jgi:PAS domain S-box-containing protein
MEPRRILIIDDDPIDRDILRSRLTAESGSVIDYRAVESGADGLILIRTWQPDCVLLDLHLPDMLGLDLLRTVVAEQLPCPIIVITAYGSEEIAADAMRIGAADYLIKGRLDNSALAHSVERVLEREGLRRQVERQRLAIEEQNEQLKAALERERVARIGAEESETRYRTLAEAMPQIVWTATHPAGDFDYVNDRWARSTGAGQAAALGHRWVELLHPEDRLTTIQKWSAARANNSQFETECRLRSGDGSFRSHLLRAVPLTKGGLTLRWLGTFTDLEEQKRAEQLLGHRQRLESIGLLAGGVAHDFNNLLVGIIGSASYGLELLPCDHDCRPALETVLTSGERAAHLVRQMLAYAGKGQFVTERLDLSKVVQKTWELVRTTVPNDIDVQFLTRPGLPPLLADGSQIEQVVMNLLINAAESIPSGQSGRVIVHTDLAALNQPLRSLAGDLEPGQYLLLEVRDNGCGMDENTCAKIFDPFFTTKFTGRGLGLAAVQGILKKNGGAILVQSEPGHGTTFKVYFQPAADAASASNVVEIDDLRVNPANRILVVDEEQMIRTVARGILEHAGYQVQMASSGAEAIETVRQSQPFSLILLDAGMSKIDGFKTLVAIRAIDPKVPILLSSGFAESEIRRLSQEHVVSGFIQKPYSAKELRDKAATHLRNPERVTRSRSVG